MVGIFLFILFAVFVYADTSYMDSSRVEQASEAARTLVAASNRIYETGPGTQTFVYITLPDGTLNSSITDNEVVITVQTSKGDSDIVRATIPMVNGSIPAGAGTYKICMSVLDSGIVNICMCTNITSPAVGDVQPPSVTFISPTPANGITVNYSSITINATATDDNVVTSCTLHFDGSYEDMYVLGSGASVNCYLKKYGVQNGWHYYNVTAVDGSLNEGISETRNVNVSYITSDKTYANAMMGYYDSGASQKPRYRLWNKTAWGAESESSDLGKAVGNWLLVVSSPKSSEKAMFAKEKSQAAKPGLVAEIWDGSSWGNVKLLSSYNGDKNSPGTYDAVYEQSSGRLIAVYMDYGASTSIPRYRIWNGTGWSDEGVLNNPQCGNIKFVKLAANPNSNEIIAAVLGACGYIHAQVWNGTVWMNSSSNLLSTDAYTYTSQEYDVAYEQNSGRAMVVWQDVNVDKPKYAVWDGSSWSSEKNASSIGAASGKWYKLAPRRDSNKLLLATSDGNADLNVQFWDGSSWGAATELDDSIQTYSGEVRNFDAAFEQLSTPARAIVAYADYGNSTPKYFVWNGTSWGSKKDAADVGTTPYWVQLEPDPYSDAMFLGTNDGDSDINVQFWYPVNSTFGEKFEASTSSGYEQKCFSIAFDEAG